MSFHPASSWCCHWHVQLKMLLWRMAMNWKTRSHFSNFNGLGEETSFLINKKMFFTTNRFFWLFLFNHRDHGDDYVDSWKMSNKPVYIEKGDSIIDIYQTNSEKMKRTEAATTVCYITTQSNNVPSNNIDRHRRVLKFTSSTSNKNTLLNACMLWDWTRDDDDHLKHRVFGACMHGRSAQTFLDSIWQQQPFWKNNKEAGSTLNFESSFQVGRLLGFGWTRNIEPKQTKCLTPSRASIPFWSDSPISMCSPRRSSQTIIRKFLLFMRNSILESTFPCIVVDSGAK